MRYWTAPLWFLSSVAWASRPNDRNWDRFNYDATVENDFGPEDWNRVRCPNLDVCLGWPDGWEHANGWELDGNSCLHCPADQANDRECRLHHQSPINLNRDPSIPEFKECEDDHWMRYLDSTCSWEQLKEANAFRIERHALRVQQPMEEFINQDENDELQWRVACPRPGGRKFGRIDFSNGFLHWWFLSHMDIHTPSEHTQNGKRYDAELQMHHFYSLSGEEAGVDNEMAVVSIFLQAYPDVPHEPYLDKLICQWRAVEERTREQCGLGSVTTHYPGCWNYNTPPDNTRNRHLRHKRTTAHKSHTPTAMDLLWTPHYLYNHTAPPRPNVIQIEDHPPFPHDAEWDAFIHSQLMDTNNSTVPQQQRRHLLNYDHVGPWFNYWAMLSVRTEYYFRYSGTQTVPPCHGPFTDGTRANTNHWRVLKDPIRIHPIQLKELQRLLAERIAPADAPLDACQPDTAGKHVGPQQVHVARPLQDLNVAHFMTYCECNAWDSRWPQDRNWCHSVRASKRVSTRPYNFETPLNANGDGF